MNQSKENHTHPSPLLAQLFRVKGYCCEERHSDDATILVFTHGRKDLPLQPLFAAAGPETGANLRFG